MSMEIINLEEHGKGKRTKVRKHPPVFEYLNRHAKRRFELINKKRLRIPVELYQRDEATGKIAHEIALHFDPVAFGCLTVIEKKDSSLDIADGGTRWNGAMEREDIGNLPCLVFSGLTDQEAAEVFLRINLNRRRLGTGDQQHGELFAKHDLAVRAQAAEDLFIKHQIGFDSLTVLRSCLKSSVKETEALIGLAPEFAAERHITGRVFKSLVKLETILNKNNETLVEARNVKRLQRGFGNLDRTLCAILPPTGPGKNRTVYNATVIARALGIRLPKDESGK